LQNADFLEKRRFSQKTPIFAKTPKIAKIVKKVFCKIHFGVHFGVRFGVRFDEQT
jgi:hypothetical protein